ncbi:MAG: hypothetical protein A2015_13890 [Spirochaetes bacterium GWF1_31_7]|nr:MAG: hypothetical protein A2Y30_10935 [Spirochaetes bacterium GWE1_32_154]OHD46167.1 MAG: hypothetical protein A2Y29_08685 [Spirochaetes bacterium GWE2_31_10]OHD49909.1 MAG: hypothetical protein A2015_13890 [Spirochaetes bacterium GWF1_31_7]OHD74384.1 MAG: hypothetical protein A2355_01890 [Spirochaetes bacterium RIFOXYB1_FULL_32_8]HBD96549.1 hypothetical protein [Spirochaetia bacterium]
MNRKTVLVMVCATSLIVSVPFYAKGNGDGTGMGGSGSGDGSGQMMQKGSDSGSRSGTRSTVKDEKKQSRKQLRTHAQVGAAAAECTGTAEQLRKRIKDGTGVGKETETTLSDDAVKSQVKSTLKKTSDTDAALGTAEKNKVAKQLKNTAQIRQQIAKDLEDKELNEEQRIQKMEKNMSELDKEYRAMEWILNNE